MDDLKDFKVADAFMAFANYSGRRADAITARARANANPANPDLAIAADHAEAVAAAYGSTARQKATAMQEN